MVTADFLLHAVLLGQWWRSTEQFWRPPAELFALIPFAYASFALYAAGLLWLLISIRGRRPRLREAALIGLSAGAFIGATSALAIYSAVSLPRSALLVFPVSFAVVFAAGATTAALVLRALRPWRRLALVTLVLVFLFVVGVVLQNVFFPTPQSHRVPTSVTQAPPFRLPSSCAAA
jgi:branched-subunit amino acid ABC-type transport system permease component